MKITQKVFVRFLPRGSFLNQAGDGEGRGTVLGLFWDHFGTHLYSLKNNENHQTHVVFVFFFDSWILFDLAGDWEGAGDHFRNTLYFVSIIPI